MTADQAFREALFDALADDEGAEYWTHIYGQPMHSYPREEAERVYGGAVGDEEYASYVRGKMWERSHQAVIEERERKEREREREKERERRRDRERREADESFERWDGVFQNKLEESLKRRRDKVEVRQWEEAWKRYKRDWDRVKEELDVKRKGDSGQEDGTFNARGTIPWPVESGKARHVAKDAAELFFRHALSKLDATTRNATLRAERVRWHPDKIQHRFGGQNIDSATMKLVNAVFLVVDAMYNDIKGKD